MRIYRDIKLSEIFYYLFWIIMIYAKGIGLYEGLIEYKICLTLALFCVGLKFLLTSYRLMDLFWIVPAGVLGVWIYLHSHDQSAFLLIAMMIGMKDIKLSRIFKISLAMWAGCFIFSVFRTFCGGYAGVTLVHEKFGLGPIVRWSLGFTHPNVLHITYVVIAALILYCWNLQVRKSQWGISLLLLVGNCYVFLYSLSTTGFLLMTLMLVSNLYLTTRKKLGSIEKILLQCILPFCIIFSLFIPVIVNVDGKFFSLVNGVLNNRYLATRLYLTEIGISLWGQEIPSLYNFALDCSYTEAILSYGLVAFICIMIGYMLTIHKMIKTDRKTELAIMLSLLIAGISEPFLFNASYKNIIILFVGECLYSLGRSSGRITDKYNLRKVIRFAPKFDKKIRIEYNNMKEMRSLMSVYWKKIRVYLYVTGAVGMVCSGIIMALFAHRPDSIFIDVGSTDCGRREECYLNVENLPEGFNSEIYNYPGSEGAMYEFSGMTTRVEYIRKIVSAGIWGFLGTVTMGMILLTIYTFHKSGNRLEISLKFDVMGK